MSPLDIIKSYVYHNNDGDQPIVELLGEASFYEMSSSVGTPPENENIEPVFGSPSFVNFKMGNLKKRALAAVHALNSHLFPKKEMSSSVSTSLKKFPGTIHQEVSCQERVEEMSKNVSLQRSMEEIHSLDENHSKRQKLSEIVVKSEETVEQCSAPFSSKVLVDSSDSGSSSNHEKKRIAKRLPKEVTPYKRYRKINPEKQLIKLLFDKGVELDQALKNALGNVTTDFEISPIPNMGNGLKATKAIPAGTSICGIMNGVLPKEYSESEEPISSAYTFDIKMKIGKKVSVFQLDGNTSSIHDPLQHKERLFAHAQSGLGKESSILQLINYSPKESANVAFQEVAIKCNRLTIFAMGVVAIKNIEAGEELRIDYGDLYFNLSHYYFFESFRKNLSGKTIDRAQLWKLSHIAIKYCQEKSGGVKTFDDNSQEILIETLDGESQLVLRQWKELFFKTLEDLAQKKAVYSKSSPIENSQKSKNSKELAKSIKTKLQLSQDQKRNNFIQIMHHKEHREFQSAYVKIKESVGNPAFIINEVQKIKFSSLDSTLRTIVAFLFSDLDDNTKNIILRNLAKVLEAKLQTISKPERMGYANPQLCIFKNTTFLHLVAWLSDDEVFAKHMIQLHQDYSPDSFKKSADGYGIGEYADYYGNAMTKKLIIEAELQLKKKKEEEKKM